MNLALKLASAPPRFESTEPQGVERGKPQSDVPAEPLEFDRIYDDNVRFVWRTVRRLGVADEDCDDAVQDVFLIVHRKLADFRPEAPLRHWLYRLAAGIARDTRRKRRRKDPRQHGLIPVPATDDVADLQSRGPAEATERAAAARLIRHLLLELTDARREVFVLSQLEQMTAPEIAEILEIPLNTVYSRLRRARTDFEEALERHRARLADPLRTRTGAHR